MFVSIAWCYDRDLNYSQKITIAEGLSHNVITSIFEDSRGYLWMSTFDGLNRYDGYELKVYKNTLQKDWLLNSRVRCVNEDSKGNLWIGTEEGISIYYYDEEKFVDIYANKIVGKGNIGPIVRNIIISKDNSRVICSTEGEGILVFNNDYELLQQYDLPKEISKANVLFFECHQLNDLNYLFSTSIGIISFNIKSGQFKHILKSKINHCNSLLSINDSTLLAIPNSGGLLKLNVNRKNAKVKYVTKVLANERIKCAAIDELGDLWLGTQYRGVIKIQNTKKLLNGKPFKQFEFRIPDVRMRVNCIISTSNKGCWVGTFDEGAFRFNVHENIFSSYNVGMNLEYGLRVNNIVGISPLDDDRAYVLAGTGSLGLFNTKTQSFEPLTFDLPAIWSRRVQNVFVDSKGNIWLYINKIGFAFVASGSRDCVLLEKEKYGGLQRFIPRAFAEDNKGNLWIRSNSDIRKLEFSENGEIEKISSLSDNNYFRSNALDNIKALYVDELYDYLWFGTKNEGLFRVDFSNGNSLLEAEVNDYQHDKSKWYSISSNFVVSITRTFNGDLWVGMERGGICRVLNSNAEPEFRVISQKDGLSNNVVREVIDDKLGNLWITTNAGLNMYDTQKSTLRKFGVRDGLLFDDFMYVSACLNNGTIILSGLDGFSYFNPNDLSEIKNLPNLEFEDLMVLNKNIAPGDSLNGRVLLNTRLNNTPEITLDHDENVFSLELKALHFSSPENYYFRYKLAPFEKEWIEVTTDRRRLVYNGLQPGRYKLKVQASNSIKKWTDTKELIVFIEPPFWKTYWAYSIYVVMALLAAYIVIFFIARIQKLNYNLEIEKLEKDNVKKINAAKLRFFSDISHEIRTPITLISGPISQMIDRYKGNPELNEKLQLVKRQSTKISQLVDQVHDFQKSDANLLEMNYTEFDFNVFLDELLSDFYFLAKHENKELKVEGCKEKIKVYADKDKLCKVLNNLLNNAFKHTKAQDSISVDFKVDGKELLIDVKDTGRGIADEDIPYIFERFYQSKHIQSTYSGGSGIGLAFSKRLVDLHQGSISAKSVLNKGSVFTVNLPIVRGIYTIEEEQLLLAEEHEADKSWKVEDVVTDIAVNSEFADSVIYLAEDNVEMREYICDTLSKYFKVKFFENGQECLDEMEQEWPDLVLSDILMPDLNGLDLCKHVKSDVKTSHIPVILLTACIAEDDRIKGIQIGADAYIKKPFNMHHLVARIESLLKSRKLLRDRFLLDIPLTLDKNEDANKDNAFLEKLYGLMSENLSNQDLDLDSFARELFLSRSLFFKKVKAVTNCTPYELLKAYRIKKAAEFLAQDNVSVNEAYLMTGFKSRTHFTKLFKEKYNVTPGKYASEVNRKYI